MRFNKTPLHGAFVVEIEANRDHRGYFARTWCAEEFARIGLPPRLTQASISHNDKCGTVRGMHMQLPPSNEAKLVRCTRGRIYDVVIDLRPASDTYLRHFGVELAGSAHTALYIPPLMLHGFQTLEDHSEVFYQMTDRYEPELSFGARWDDPAFDIDWPFKGAAVIAERDATYPDFDSQAYESRVAATDAGRS